MTDSQLGQTWITLADDATGAEPHEKESVMANDSTGTRVPLFVGMDVHQETITLAVAPGDGSEPRVRATIPNTPKALLKQLERIGPAERLRCCYEAGPTGYSTWRLLAGWGIACTVVAPSLIPKKPGDRVKTDRRDALQLARLHRLGDLTAVWVPTPEHEALRDLCRAREAAKRDQERARHRLLKLLARHDLHPPSGAPRWTRAYRAWLAELTLPQAALQTVLEEHRQQFAEMEARVARLTARVKAEVQDGPFATVLGALQCLKGVGPITAVTLIAELGDLTRFRRPRMLMGYSGLTPSEYSSGGRIQRGHITKCGNGHVRFVTIESAWHARWGTRPDSRALKRRRAEQPEAIVQIAKTAQRRLCQRYYQLLKRGKTPGQATTAVGRELLGFVWAIGQALAHPATDEGAASGDDAAVVAA
jgi:transposase